MEGEAHKRQVLRAFLAFIFAGLFAVVVFVFVPVSGVRTDIVVMLRDSASHTHAEQIVENTVIIAKSAIRETAEVTDIKKTEAQRLGAAGAFSVTTYGHDYEMTESAHNKAVRAILMRENTYFAQYDAMSFQRVGSSYTTTRWFFATVMLMIASVLGTMCATGIMALRRKDDDEDRLTTEQKERYADLFARMQKTRAARTSVEKNNVELREQDEESASVIVPEKDMSRSVPQEQNDEFVDDAYSEITEEVSKEEIADALDEQEEEKDEEEIQEVVEEIIEDLKPTQTISLPTLKDAPGRHKDSKSFLSRKKNAVEFGSGSASVSLSSAYKSPAKEEKSQRPAQAMGGLPTARGAQAAPGNLPVVDASAFYGDAVQEVSNKEMKDEKKKNTNPEPEEPTDEELKERLNQLLRGEL